MKLFIQITTILTVSLLVGFSQTHALNEVTIDHGHTFEPREADKSTPERERQRKLIENMLPSGIDLVIPNDKKNVLRLLFPEDKNDKKDKLRLLFPEDKNNQMDELLRPHGHTLHGHTFETRNDCKEFKFPQECERQRKLIENMLPSGIDLVIPNDKKDGLIRFLLSLPPKDKYVEFKKPAETPNLKKGSKFEEGTNRSIVQRYIDYYGNTPATDTCMQDICKSKYQNINTQNRCKAYTAQAYFEIWLSQ